MGRCRSLAVLVVAAVLAACSAGAGEVALTRSELPDAVATTAGTASTVPAVPTAAGEAVAAPDPGDPIPGGVSVPRRATGRRAGPSRPQPTGHIDIPAIGLSHSTYEGIDLATINYGPSHWPGSAMPGQRGNSVFAGHRTTYSRPFWSINELGPGDQVTFTTADGRFTYRVTRTFVVHWRDTSIVEPTDEATFTIFACHPRGSARQRIVVQGELAQTTRAAPPTTTTTTTTTTAPPPEDQSGSIVTIPR